LQKAIVFRHEDQTWWREQRSTHFKTKQKLDMVKNTKVLDRWLTKCSKNIFVYFNCSKIQNSIYSMCDLDKQKCQFPFMSLLWIHKMNSSICEQYFNTELFDSIILAARELPPYLLVICTPLSTVAIFLNI